MLCTKTVVTKDIFVSMDGTIGSRNENTTTSYVPLKCDTSTSCMFQSGPTVIKLPGAFPVYNKLSTVVHRVYVEEFPSLYKDLVINTSKLTLNLSVSPASSKLIDNLASTTIAIGSNYDAAFIQDVYSFPKFKALCTTNNGIYNDGDIFETRYIGSYRFVPINEYGSDFSTFTPVVFNVENFINSQYGLVVNPQAVKLGSSISIRVYTIVQGDDTLDYNVNIYEAGHLMTTLQAKTTTQYTPTTRGVLKVECVGDPNVYAEVTVLPPSSEDTKTGLYIEEADGSEQYGVTWLQRGNIDAVDINHCIVSRCMIVESRNDNNSLHNFKHTLFRELGFNPVSVTESVPFGYNIYEWEDSEGNGNIQTYIKPQGTINITQNGTVDVSQYASATIAVAGSSAIADEIIPLVNGGDHHSITGVDLSFDTVTASSMLLGTTAHDSAGNAITGTYVPNSDDNKTIKFIDYDGTVLHEYTPVEFAQLDSLPRNPTHAGLTSQGWNWTKTQITNQINNVGGIIKVGQMYVTNDGKTRIYISVDNIERAKFIISFACTVAGGVTIDWGDDSALYVPSYTELKGYAHTYSAVGDYVVTLTVTNGEMIWSGNSSSGIIANRGGSTNNIITKIKKIEMGTGVTSIGDYWLQNCFALESITIPSTITSFGVNAFYGCYGLKCITIPSGITTLTSQMFYNCYNLKEVILSSTITTTTGQNIFYNCRVLNDVTLPYGLSNMATGIFYGCEDFENIVIPSSITAVGNNAFYNCHSLKTVTLPNGLTSIGSNAFYNCYALETINIPATVTSIGSQAFLQCFTLKDISVPSGLTTLEAGAFYNCVGITSLVIPNNITSIGNNTFRGCITLTSVNIPSSATSIGEYAFGTANSLATLTIPSGITSIGANAFDSCQGVAEYHFLPTTPPTITSTTFNAIASDCVIYVPQASLATYQAAENWSTYASQMVGE